MKGIMFHKDVWQGKLRALKEYGEAETRRLIHKQPQCEGHEFIPFADKIDWVGYKYEGQTAWFCEKCGWGSRHIDEYSAHGFLPRYRVGEVVYVKEAWCLKRWITNPLLGSAIRPNQYEGLRIDIGYGDNSVKQFYVREWPEGWDASHRLRNGDGSLQSPMFLKEIFARYFIEILEVRPERLQEITEEGALREGIPSDPTIAVYEYSRLWDSINPKTPWSSNCWVWVYRFLLTTPELK